MNSPAALSPELEAALVEQLQIFRQGTIDFMRQSGSIKGDEPSPEQIEAVTRAVAKHREELIQIHNSAVDHESAAAAPFPGPLRKAFCDGPTIVLGYTLQPVNLALLSILERLQLPFLMMIELIYKNQDKSPAELGALVDAKIHLTIDQQMAAIYCFVTPIQQIETQLKQGRDRLIEHVRETIGLKLHPHYLGTLNGHIIRHYLDSFTTIINHEPEKAPGDTSFTAASSTAKTASVGA